ncbi:ATP-binding protein [Thalassospira mesophila]|uniref:histidine kinase n=1 Tax=Thalassospira mesophila TaxID=1293891 RepID=A0A1Y2KX79_9PROT|nr:ATP-binding protein [Thalassospira mesophila]OSQ36712.1 hypothetical protein TMES_16640 [Thalassospira mesophila]
MFKKYWSNLALARKFALGSAAMTVCVTLIVGVYATLFVRNQLLLEVQQEIDREAITGAQRISLYLGAVHHNLKNMAASSLVINGIVDSYGRDNYLTPFLSDFRISDSLLVDVGLFDFKGKLIARSSPEVEEDIAGEAGFNEVINGRSNADYHHHEQAQDSYIAITYPVFYEATQRPEGVLLGRVHLDNFPDILKVNDQSLFYFKLTDRTGVKVGNWPWPENQEILSRQYDVALETPMDKLGLTLHVARRAAEALMPMQRLIMNIGIAAVIVIALTVFVAVLVGRQLSRPLRALERAATRIATEGYFDVDLPDLGNDEVGRLAGSFREMLGHINVSYSVLEARVISRTRELDEARLHLRDSASQLQSILNNVVDSIVTIDVQGNVQSCNNAAVKLFACPASQLIGKNIVDLIDIDDLDVFLVPTSNDFRNDQRRTLKEAVLHPARGKAVPIEYAIGEQMEIAETCVMTLLIRNITERKEIERLKEEFVSSVSHELRTPLTSIRGALALAKRDPVVPGSNRLQKLLDVAEENSKRLGDLVNDILDLEKLENGKMSFTIKPLKLEELVQTSINSCTPYIRKHGKQVRLLPSNQSFEIAGDEGRLMQVLNNLLSNAAKYSGPQTVIDVVLAKVGDNVRVSVIDQGPGIAPALRAFMFSRFWQADGSNTKNESGTGLGLAITKSLMEGNGGSVQYRSRLGVGSIFHIDLPVKNVSPCPTASNDIAFAAGPFDQKVMRTLGKQAEDTENVMFFGLSSAAQAVLYLESGAFLKIPTEALPPEITRRSPTEMFAVMAQHDGTSHKKNLYWLSERNA